MVTATNSPVNYASGSAVRIGVSSSREALKFPMWDESIISIIYIEEMYGKWMDMYMIDIKTHAFKLSWSIFQLC